MSASRCLSVWMKAPGSQSPDNCNRGLVTAAYSSGGGIPEACRIRKEHTRRPLSALCDEFPSREQTAVHIDRAAFVFLSICAPMESM